MAPYGKESLQTASKESTSIALAEKSTGRPDAPVSRPCQKTLLTARLRTRKNLWRRDRLSARCNAKMQKGSRACPQDFCAEFLRSGHGHRTGPISPHRAVWQCAGRDDGRARRRTAVVWDQSAPLRSASAIMTMWVQTVRRQAAGAPRNELGMACFMAFFEGRGV